MHISDRASRARSAAGVSRAHSPAPECRISERTGRRHRNKVAQQKFRHDPSSIWAGQADLPKQRHKRSLSWSKCGLSGNSPTWVKIRDPSPNRERACEKRIEAALKMKDGPGTLEELWEIFIDSFSEDHSSVWPVQNCKFVPVRKRIIRLIQQEMKQALESGDVTKMRAVAKMAENRVNILMSAQSVSGGELDELKKKIEVQTKAASGDKEGLAKACQRLRRASQMNGTADNAETWIVLVDQVQGKTEAKESLWDAVRRKDVKGLRAAAQDALDRGVVHREVAKATSHLTVSVKKEFLSNKPGDKFFRKGCFQNLGRSAYIVNCADKDVSFLTGPLEAAGLSVVVDGDVSAALREPCSSTVWLISGSEPLTEERSQLLSQLADFNRSGGGLAVLGSGGAGPDSDTAFTTDASALMNMLDLGAMSGYFRGEQTLEEKPDVERPGFASHPVFTGIMCLDEGFGAAAIDEKVLRAGFVELLRGSDGNLLAALREPTDNSKGGPLLLHAGCSQLEELCGDLENYEAASSQAHLVANLAAYMSLRKQNQDLTEIFQDL